MSGRAISLSRSLVCMGLALALVVAFVLSGQHAPWPPSPPTATDAPPTATAAPAQPAVERSLSLLVDDFVPRPYQGQAVYFFNRLEGDRGALNDSRTEWGYKQVTTTIAAGNSWGGVWMSLNHPIREGLPVNFSAILPPQITPAYQSRITGITVLIARGTPGRAFRLELKDGSTMRWQHEIALEGGPQTLSVDLPALGNVNQLVWVLDRASAGDFVVVQRVSFTATTRITDTATAAFVWSYGMLLANWNPDTGLVRDKARDAGGEFDAVQATGCLAAATASAEQLGVVGHDDAVQLVDKIGRTLLTELPRLHGLWPHWVKMSHTGAPTIVENTEWSSVDTALAALGLLAAQSGLGMDTSGTEQMLQAIDWEALVTPDGISHGYSYGGNPIPYAWDTFGGESWLVELAYAAATGQVTPIASPAPPTANGSGFIDELAWLFVPPPSGRDYWGTDWAAYRSAAADKQTLHFYPCFVQPGLFGLSAGEVPAPAQVSPGNIYQAFGVGGRFTAVNDGAALFGRPVVVPHYSAMIASLRPREAIKMWDWLMNAGFFTPLNNVESLAFLGGLNCDASDAVWNQLKGSWNLSLQTLGWGRYLAERRGQVPILWQAATANPLLRRGYRLLAPSEPSAPSAQLPSEAPAPWSLSRECEGPDESTVGQMIWRSNASGSQVHGQFGSVATTPWPAKSGYVRYNNIPIPPTDRLYLTVRYSKHSPSSVPILIYLGYEQTPRATFYPTDQGDWNRFVSTEPLLLGGVGSGVDSIKFYTAGQDFGVADLDMFVLTAEAPVAEATPAVDKSELLVWYDFEGDFQTSGIVADRSGHGLDARVRGAAIWVTGISGGRAISLTGNEYVRAQSNPVAGRNAVSFSLWFKTDHPENNYKLAGAAWWNGGPASGWIMATHIPEFWSDDTRSLYFPDIHNNENHFRAGAWVHEAVTYDGSRIKEYTDGQLVNDWPTTGAAIGQGQPMVVGAWPQYSAYNFEGRLDEFKIFARALTQQEVQALYEQGQ